MLRMYLLQVMFGLSDEGTEDAILDSRAMQRFMHIDLMREQVPDATTLAKFRHILERKGLGKAMLDELNSELEAAGVMMRGGSIVDATFIEAPSSTKNEGHSRDPEAHQSKKGKNWHFGFKAHIGVDAGSGLVHTVETTAANVSDAFLIVKRRSWHMFQVPGGALARRAPRDSCQRRGQLLAHYKRRRRDDSACTLR
jgi:transposase, IS5 family